MLSVIFRHPVSPGTISNSSSRTPETPTLPNQAKVTPPREHPSGKGQKRIIGDDPRSYAPGGKTLQGKNFQRVFQKAFLMRGRPLKTVHGGDPPPKEIATKEGPFDRNSTLGHGAFDRGIIDFNYSPPGREFTVATDLSCRSQDNCARQADSFIR